MKWDTGGGVLGIFCVFALLYIVLVCIFGSVVCETDLGDCLQ
jgi:hypothetical protein